MELRKIIKDILVENENITLKDLKPRAIEIEKFFTKKTNKIITLTGFRRVGKTYLLFLIREQAKDKFCIYFNRDLIERFAIKEEALLNATIKLILNSLMISRLNPAKII